MAEHSKIEWTDATWNPITGCSVVSPGCTNCYAMKLAGTRLRNHPSRAGLTDSSRAGPVWNGKVRLNDQWLEQPIHWRRGRNVFVCAHGDLFHEDVPDDWIDAIFAVMALTPQHNFQVLTKRSARMQEYMLKLTHDGAAERLSGAAGARFGDEADVWVANYINGWSNPSNARDHGPANGTVPRWPLPNVWMGVSVEDQARADERIPDLLATPAHVRFLSCEPLLGPVNLLVTDHRGHDISALRGIACDPSDPDGPDEYYRTGKIHWVIAGGESGAGARPSNPAWFRVLRDQCASADVPFHFKQWGEWHPGDGMGDDIDGSAFGCFDDADRWVHPVQQNFAATRQTMFRIGKKRAGRTLDGVTHDGMPGERT
ncbi:phage Gp37/Gp68 family protein [Mameliella sp. AT18]|uniref:DUF5131 family protein n=1 Tax=Mameliella sp. AT18 TaxID=3028385 RepID=UPI0008410275|nr:phage Gp37/Gp68 family protein [Mameliella sp. AT18]MDD9730882.1 phage Gp37/Gp68 family protein [Mameliella sp. AT18]ODM47237.1 hypothetical protein A9320_23260 [Ruegeria sp. PBVC088]